MRLRLAKSAGFCFGVKRALSIALKAAKSGRHVLMLGDIVHNEIVVDQLKKSGIKKRRVLGEGKGKTLLIRAHGTQKSTIAKARRAGYEIIDATCPMVKEIHAIASRLEEDGRTVIIIGDKAHDEVRGIVGQLKTKPIIISSPSDIRLRDLARIRKAGIVVQSTQDEETVFKIIERLKRCVSDLIFKNTICVPTRTKQKEAKVLPVKNDIVIVVGSRRSANTKRLYQISRALNKKTYWVNSADEVKRGWLGKSSSVGITAGASTPEESIGEVMKRIRSYRDG